MNTPLCVSRRAFLFGFTVAASASAFLLAGCGSGGNDNDFSPSPPTVGPTLGEVLSQRQVGAFTRAQIDNVTAASGIPNFPPAQSNVKLIEITYRTLDTNGGYNVASGLLAVPTEIASPLPLVVYHHGTTFARTDVPSNPASLEATALSALFAAQGYAVAAPDYIGLGKSTGTQSFEYADGLATTSRDMVRAARFAAPDLGYTLSSKLFLTGYSEGGYATLAAQRILEQTPLEFVITATAPLDGPYDLSGTMKQTVLTSDKYTVTAFIAGLLTQQNAVGKFYASENEVFVPPYNDGRVSALFDGTRTNAQVFAALPSSPAQLLTPAFIQAVSQNPNHPVNVYLRANDVTNFTPIAPVKFFHASSDTTVPFANAEVAVARMQARGAANVSLVDLGNTYDHDTAIVPAVLGAKAFFDTLR